MSNTAVRVIVGIIGIPLIITIALAGGYVFLVFCVVVSFLCMNEFFNLFETPLHKPSWFLRWAGGINLKKSIFLLVNSLIVVCFYFTKFNYVVILYFVMFLYLIIDELFKAERHFEAIGTWLLSILYISSPFGLLSLMNSDNFILLFGADYAVICMGLVWVSDTFAFWGGKTYGKHVLAEKISPKKTWEGSVTGFIFTIITGIMLSVLFPEKLPMLNMIIISVIVAVFAQLGDLFESHLKRTVDIKDSSRLIPGHGGFLDRFDSLLFAVPAVYIFLYLKSTL
jgi:phosphatidate cytidylyltransferase